MRSFAHQPVLFMLTVERLASNEVRPVCFKSKIETIYGTLVCVSVLSDYRYRIHLISFLIANIYVEMSVFFEATSYSACLMWVAKLALASASLVRSFYSRDFAFCF